MLADQLIFAPIFLFVFFWINGGLQGLSVKKIKANIIKNYPDVLIAKYKVIIITKNRSSRIQFYFNCLSSVTRNIQLIIFITVVANRTNPQLLVRTLVTQSPCRTTSCTSLEYLFGLEN